MFTNEGKKLAPIFDKADRAEIAEDDIEHLKASQQKLLDARPEMRQLDKEIQNIHVILGEEDTADKDFVDADNISDTHSVLLRQIDKILRRNQLRSGLDVPTGWSCLFVKKELSFLPEMLNLMSTKNCDFCLGYFSSCANWNCQING